MKIILILFYLFFITASFSFPHEHHEHHEHESKKADTVTVVGKDTIAVNGIPIDSAKVMKEEEKAHQTEEEEHSFVGSLTEHMHNKIVHLVIGFALAGFLLSLFGFKNESLDLGIKVLAIVAGLSAIAAYFAGVAQQEPFINTVKESFVGTHKVLGIITGLSIWIWIFFLFYKPVKKFAWLIGIVVFILVLITGLYGGMVAH